MLVLAQDSPLPLLAYGVVSLDDEVHSNPLSADVIPSDVHIPRGWSGEQPARELQHIHDGSKAIEMLGLEMTSRSDMTRDTLASVYQRWPWKA